VPATIQASLAARLDRLGPAKEVAQIGAVIGRTFTHKLIAAVSDKGSEALEEALRRLVKAELLFQRGVSPEALYTFKHALIQDAAYDSLLKIKRSTIHMRVAETLVQNSGDISAAAPELIAHHYSEAGHAEQAVEHWLDAGQRSIRRSTHLEAIAHLRSGLSQLMTLPETADRGHKELTYQINLGAAYFVAKGYASPEAGQAYQRACELRRFEDNVTLVSAAFWGLWLFHLVAANHRAAMDAAKEVLKLAPGVEDAESWISANASIAISRLHIEGPASARPHLEIVTSLYDAEKHHLLFADRHAFDFGPISCNYSAWTLWLLGYPDQAHETNERAWEIIKSLSHPYTIARSYHWSAVVPMMRGEWQRVRERSEASVNASNELGFPLVGAAARILFGTATALEGNIESGLEHIRDGIDTYRTTGARFQLSLWSTFLAQALLASGRAEDGLEALASAQELVEKSEEHVNEAEIARVKGQLLRALSGDFDAEAEEAYGLSLAVARKQQAKSLELRAATSLASLWRDQGKREEARDLLNSIYSWFTEGFDTADLKEAKALLDELS